MFLTLRDAHGVRLLLYLTWWGLMWRRLYCVLDSLGRALSALTTLFDLVGRMRSMLYYVLEWENKTALW